MEKPIITVAPTGSVPRKKDTPYVPMTPDEIAETAYSCEREGASIIHVHCRDQNENPTEELQRSGDTRGPAKNTIASALLSWSGGHNHARLWR